VVVGFRAVPVCVIDDPEACAALRRNRLVIRLQPDEGLRLSFCTRVPGGGMDIREEDLDFRYADVGAPGGEAYEQVLLDGLAGRSSYFLRSDGVEASWNTVAPLLAAPGAGELHSYDPESWGPQAAAKLPAADGRAWLAGY
jgi:glucose-6-phosphate 1-dehydrogenase